MVIFQIDKEDVDRSSTLTKRDIGKWAFVLNGCIQITNCKSRDEVERKLDMIFR